MACISEIQWWPDYCTQKNRFLIKVMEKCEIFKTLHFIDPCMYTHQKEHGEFEFDVHFYIQAKAKKLGAQQKTDYCS